MYKIYFKQAIAMLKQNKFISIITIAGTALAIMMIMVIIVTDSIKNISIAPEINRNKTFYVKNYMKQKKDPKARGLWTSTVSYEYYKNYLSDIKNADLITAIERSWSGNEYMVKKNGTNEMHLKEITMVDANYWKFFSFSFTDGRPFTQEEFESGIRNAVITDRLAKEVFGNIDPLNKTIEIDFREYKVIGIVKGVSQVFRYGRGEAYIPYTTKDGYENRAYHVLYLLSDKGMEAGLEEEVREAERKFDLQDEEWNMTFWGPYNHRIMQLNTYSNVGPDEVQANIKILLIFLILLLIPAINLSSFSMSRIKRRTEEIGIRKAFGAKKHVILIQVVYENMITSLIGGLIGLLFSYFIVIWLKEWLLGVDSGTIIPFSTLVSIPVFIGVFLVCFLINILSAGYPAYRASKMKIVDSLNKKNA